MGLTPIPEILEALRSGKMVILIDEETRENEGDLLVAAEFATPEAVNFMTKHGRGLICLALDSKKVEALNLPPMTPENTSRFNTAFTVSIEAKEGVTTGISAQDRAQTVQTAIRDDCRPADLVRPGHVFPLRAKDGGVLVRAGQTEGAVDLARLAGLKPAGVICEVLGEDGRSAKLPELQRTADAHGIPICSIVDLIDYRRKRETLVKRESTVALPTEFGDFTLHLYTSIIDGEHHLALVAGDIAQESPTGTPVLVRVHSECLTGDVFRSSKCDCGLQLHAAMEMVQKEGKGVILYMRQEGRGIGLHNKIKAYELQEQGLDTVEANLKLGFEADKRDYGIGAQILKDLGITKLRLLTNNPKKLVGLKGHGLEIVERISIEMEPGENNIRYLRTKKEKLGHLLENI